MSIIVVIPGRVSIVVVVVEVVVVSFEGKLLAGNVVSKAKMAVTVLDEIDYLVALISAFDRFGIFCPGHFAESLARSEGSYARKNCSSNN